MSRYQHTKGQIKITSLRHYFMTRYSGSELKRTRKGKAAIKEKKNMQDRVVGRPVARK